MPRSKSGLTETLHEALRVAQSERRMHEEALREITNREELIKRAIEGGGGKPLPRRDTSMGVAPERLRGVLKAIKDADGPIRQADIVEATGYNSGTVSIALRVLEQRGQVQQGEILRSSRQWTATDVAASDDGASFDEDDLGLSADDKDAAKAASK